MKDIKYTVEFFSQWHCGSGLSAGADVDLLVIKDKNKLPFIPGRTMKGLIREATEQYIQFTGKTSELEKVFLSTFGDSNNGSDDYLMGAAFFANAELCEQEQTAIKAGGLTPYLYNKVTTTAIDKDGIAKEHSLRTIETVVPCKLHGYIANVDDDIAEVVVKSLGLIKHIGQKRNRGLGRCKITGTIEEGGKQ